jgi:hypothetical protein
MSDSTRLRRCAIAISFSMSFATSCRWLASSLKSQRLRRAYRPFREFPGSRFPTRIEKLLTSLYPPCPVRETLSVVLVPYRCHSLQRGQINGSTRRRRLVAAAGCRRSRFRWRTAPPTGGRGQRRQPGRAISLRIERPRRPHCLQTIASVGPRTSDRIDKPPRGTCPPQRLCKALPLT